MPLTINPAVVHPGYVGGNRWYMAYNAGLGRGANAIGAVDIIYMYPFYLPTPVATLAWGIRSTGGGAGSSCKMGIWANNPTIARPSGAPVIVDNTGIATTGTGELTFGAGALGTIGPGWYWAGGKYTGTLPTMVTIGTSDFTLATYMGFATQVAITTGIISMADAYSNNMPTIATSQSWTETSQNATAFAFKV